MTEIDNLVLEVHNHIINSHKLSSDLGLKIRKHWILITYYNSSVRLNFNYLRYHVNNSISDIEYTTKDEYFNRMMVSTEFEYEYATLLRVFEILEYCNIPYKIEVQ